ncbi:MAG: DUF3368 domain-containing protein [Thermomicrobiales bacterium]
MAIVSDSSPLVCYAKIGRLDLLHALFEDVIIPPAVYTEVVVRGAGRPGAADVASATWIQTQALAQPHLVESIGGHLDRGEAEAITLALEIRQRNILIDDDDGRTIAKRQGLSVIGSIGVLLLARSAGILTSDGVRVLLDALRSAGLYLSNSLYQYVLAQSEATRE